MVTKLLELYQKLCELGHPEYLAESGVPTIKCSEDQKVHERVDVMQAEVEEWKQNMLQLQAHFPWLLYFSVPKILLLHQLLSHHQIDLDKIIHEVSFLIINQPQQRSRLQDIIMVSIVHWVFTTKHDTRS